MAQNDLAEIQLGSKILLGHYQKKNYWVMLDCLNKTRGALVGIFQCY